MEKKLVACLVLLSSLAGFFLLQSDWSVAAMSPQFSSMPLYGKVIGVDAGHGGYDGGCVGRSGVPEKEFNLAVALKLRDELTERGATVVLSRDEDCALIDPLTTKGYKKRKELDNRLAIFREGNVVCMVSVHMNKYRNEKQKGAQVFYKKDEESGRCLAECLQAALCTLDCKNGRTASAGDYYILNACPASVLVECGFLSNQEEENLLLTDEYRQQVAESIAKGLEDYFASGIETAG